MNFPTDAMAGFHLPRDLYFPRQGNVGWLEPEEPEEDPEEEPAEELEMEVEGGPAEPAVDLEEEAPGEDPEEEVEEEGR